MSVKDFLATCVTFVPCEVFRSSTTAFSLLDDAPACASVHVHGGVTVLSETDISSQKIQPSHGSSSLHFLRTTDFGLASAEIAMFTFACFAHFHLSPLSCPLQRVEDFDLWLLRAKFFLTTWFLGSEMVWASGEIIDN